VEVAAYAENISAALDDLGLGRIDFYGMWGGGFVGLELAMSQPGKVRRLIMSNVFQHDGDMQRQLLAHYTPGIVPLWHGGHLMQCWHQLRDQGIYFPWFDATRHAVVQREPFLDTDMVHERVCSLLKAGNMYRTAYQAHFRYRTFDRLYHSPVPTVLAIRPGDPNNPRIETAARAPSHVVLRHLDPDFKRWGECFADVLDAADGERA
jgi:pimeloyl-ACP methyl ester carboxylesterase